MKKSLFICALVMIGVDLQAQVCQNATDTIYGLNSIAGSGSGQIIGINVNNAGTTFIGSPASSSANANGIGFSAVTGLYYFFNQCAAGTTEFVSYNPVNGSKVTKANPSGPALPTSSSGKIRSGAVDKGGTGYYTIFPGATTAMGYPITGPALLYYNIGANSWTLITQNFKDGLGNIVTPIQTLNSGDMAFDGLDNLWILCASSAQYALYKINAPLPTTSLGPAGSVTVSTVIPVTATPGSVSFTGIAFNSTGKLYLSTGSYTTPPGVAGNNKLYSLATPTSAFVTVGTLPNGYGDDLTSCSFPPGVLTNHWIYSNAIYDEDAEAVTIQWKINESDDITGYDIEYSNDGERWQVAGNLSKDAAVAGVKQYQYSHRGLQPGRNFYRIAEIAASGRQSFSSITMVDTRNRSKVYVGPNPVKDVLYFYNRDNTTKQLAQVYDKSGKMIYSALIAQGQQSLSVGQLSRGMYILTFLTPGLVEDRSKGYQFIKW